MIDFAEQVNFSRKNRQLEIQSYAQTFATELEKQCAKAPFQWFNFYDFWPDIAEQKQTNELSKKTSTSLQDQ